MSVLQENYEPTIVYVGHLFRVVNHTYKDGWSPIYITKAPGVEHRYTANLSCLKGLLGNRQSHNAYVREFERYIVAAFLTCYAGDGQATVHDDRFNKIIRMVNKAYSLPMGTLDVEFNLSAGILRIYPPQKYGFLSSIVDYSLKVHTLYSRLHGYYIDKPRAIETHRRYMERLLNYDVDNDILNSSVNNQ